MKKNNNKTVANESVLTPILLLQLIAVVIGLLISTNNNAGTYIFADDNYGVNSITHPKGYTGSGGILSVRLCIDPNSAHASEMVIPVQNVVATYNALLAQTGNVVPAGSSGVGVNQFDFESVAVHEVGHCLGLAHPNAASESELTGDDRYFTRALRGANGGFDINAGQDSVIGSSDDIRGDDINLMWFRQSIDDPFRMDDATIDSTTYSREISKLPSGHFFPSNANRKVAVLNGYINTEAVMTQGSFNGESQRQLGHDDVATLRYAMSGFDELAASNDDYIVNLVDGGISSSNCDIVLGFDSSQTEFAVSKTEANNKPAGSSHWVLVNANIYFNNGILWYFNTTSTSGGNMLELFTFVDQFNVPLNALITSNGIKVTIIDNSVSTLSVSISGGEYAINGGTFSSNAGSVVNDDVVVVRHTSAANYSTNINTTLVIGNVSDTFTSTTHANPNGGGASADSGLGGLSWWMCVLLLFAVFMRKPIILAVQRPN